MYDNIKHVYVLGLGAIGAKYASMIYDVDPNGIHVIVDASRKERYEREGIYVNDKRYSFHYVTTPEEGPKADLIILSVKSLDLQVALEKMRPFVHKDTIVLSLLNGIRNAQQINSSLGWDAAVWSIVYMDAVKSGNRITFGHPGKVVFGEANNKVKSPRVSAICSFFDKMGVNYTVPEDMMLALWKKFMINVVGNQLTYILDSGYGALQDNPYVLQLVQAIGEEVIQIANAQGIGLVQQDIDNMMSTMKKINPQAKTSMAQDRQFDRLSEVDIFAGEMIRLGQQLNIPTPYNFMLYNLIKGYEFERFGRH